MGHELVGIYEEVKSGTSTSKREKFKQALKALENADGIISTKLDRIARNTRDVLTLVEDVLLPHNKHLLLLDINVDTSTPTGRMILTMLSAVATLERDIINERTQGGRKDKALSGGYAYGSPAYGQRTVNRELSLHIDEQKVIELIKRHRRSGKSYADVAEYLNENKYETKQGKNWYASTVKNILDREKVKK
jgi:DNA invertase Pin-like site-specific DNA recombinase